MSLANISTVLALTAATTYAAGCKMQGGLCNNMFPCCDGLTCTDVGGGVTTCQANTLLNLDQQSDGACKVKGGFCNDMFKCCDGFVCEDIGGGVTTCQIKNDNHAVCAKEGEATYEGMPCCDAGMSAYSCWFDASMTCCYDMFLQ